VSYFWGTEILKHITDSSFVVHYCCSHCLLCTGLWSCAFATQLLSEETSQLLFSHLSVEVTHSDLCNRVAAFGTSAAFPYNSSLLVTPCHWVGVFQHFVAFILKCKKSLTAYPLRWQLTTILWNTKNTDSMTQHHIPEEFIPPPSSQKQCCESLTSQIISFCTLSFFLFTQIYYGTNVISLKTRSLKCTYM
jgi:hypothetical protein